jgi:hypothetical protein
MPRSLRSSSMIAASTPYGAAPMVSAQLKSAFASA